MHELYDNQTIYQRSKRYVEEPKFDVFLNPTKKEKQVNFNLIFLDAIASREPGLLVTRPF